MEKEKNNKSNGIIITFLVIIILVLGVLLALTVTGKIELKNDTCSENQITTNNNQTISNEKETDNNDKNDNTTTNDCNCNCTSYVSESYGTGVDNIDYDELSKISKSTYNYVKYAYTNDYSIKILSDGKVMIGWDDYLNVSNAKDMILFNGPGADYIVYILTSDGEVYKYNFSTSKDFNAIKLTEYSNIKQIFRYVTRKANAGGCDYVILVDADGKYYSLDSYCV